MNWTCDVCGNERPDAMIGVHKVFGKGAVPIQGNVKYCIDTGTCFAGVDETNIAKLARKYDPPDEAS